MKRTIYAAAIYAFLLVPVSLAAINSTIIYQATDLGTGRWQYTYEVTNKALPDPIEQFTIWFDYGLYDNLAVETADPLAAQWDEIVLQPEPVLSDDGAYDAKAFGLGIEIGHTQGPFAVSFNWLGDGLMPGSQRYEIIDPATLQTIESGSTIPEPITILLLGLGGLALRRRPSSPENT
ncbi:MAG: PEP-CTERM sorting domain-containing protein [Sedimentisphaerales bacterium]|nr:PEP-CTERM sorting domain-containing protein [Sedimentisphaerales bacterium]